MQTSYELVSFCSVKVGRPRHFLSHFHCHLPSDRFWSCTSCSKAARSVLFLISATKARAWVKQLVTLGGGGAPRGTHSNPGTPGVKRLQRLASGLLLQAAHGWVAGHGHGHRTQHQRGDGLHSQDIDLGPLRVFLEGQPTHRRVTSSQTPTPPVPPEAHRPQSPRLSDHKASRKGALSASEGQAFPARAVLSASAHHSLYTLVTRNKRDAQCLLFQARSPTGTNLQTGITS